MYEAKLHTQLAREAVQETKKNKQGNWCIIIALPKQHIIFGLSHDFQQGKKGNLPTTSPRRM